MLQGRIGWGGGCSFVCCDDCETEKKKTAGDPTVSKHIIIDPAWKTATGPDLTERKRVSEHMQDERSQGHEKREH